MKMGRIPGSRQLCQTANTNTEEKHANVVPDLPFVSESTHWPAVQDSLPSLGITVLFTLWLCGGLLYVLPNNGGSGLSLPFNTLAWIMMALGMAWLAMTLPGNQLRLSTLLRNARAISRGDWLLITGAILWTLPLFWAPSHAARVAAFPHVMALWGLLTFIWMLRRVSRGVCQYQWLTVLWVAALLQALFAFLQTTLFSLHGSFDSSRPFGIFQQVNVLASFLATGFICLLVTGNSLRLRGFRIFRWVRSFASIFLPFMLVILQSRAGWLGAGIGMLVWICTTRQSPANLRKTLLLILLGVFLALAWQFNLPALVAHLIFPENISDGHPSIIPEPFTLISKAGSNRQRWQIYQITWNLIMQHPLVGIGYGEFEGAFTHQMLQDGMPIGSTTLIHPHNELLYVWSEGGLVGLMGLLMMVCGVILSLWQQGDMRWIGFALLMPLAVHINVEYPLYQSVPHGMMLAILLSILLPSGEKWTLSRDEATYFGWEGWVGRILVLAMSVSLLIFMVGALQTQQQLTKLEHQQLWPLALDEKRAVAELTNISALSDRIDYDRHIALLMRYNLTHDSRLLKQFDSWATEFLTRHSDPNVVYSRLMIARALMPSNVATLCYTGHMQWPADKRFLCNR